MKEAAKEAFENNMHHHDTMEAIAKAYLSNINRYMALREKCPY